VCRHKPVAHVNKRVVFNPRGAVHKVVKTVRVPICRSGDILKHRSKVVSATVRVRSTRAAVVKVPGPITPGVKGTVTDRILYASESDYLADVADALKCSFDDLAYCHP
jgi:hypothetical protein